MDEFCIGGLWPAIQSLVVFLTTNIFAHAATFYLPPGTPALRTALLIISAIVSPVLLGDHAFRAIRRRRSRWWSQFKGDREMRPTSLLGGDTFEDAVVSGALAICVPLEFAPVVRGCWGLATPNNLQMVLLDHTEVQNRPEQKLLGGPTFYENRPIPPYIPFILPSTTNLPRYEGQKIAPSGSGLSQIFAIIQLFASSRQLYLAYGTTIRNQGLASPYLVVIPYLLMTLVNFIAHTFVGSYPQVTLLPMSRRDEERISYSFDEDGMPIASHNGNSQEQKNSNVISDEQSPRKLSVSYSNQMNDGSASSPNDDEIEKVLPSSDEPVDDPPKSRNTRYNLRILHIRRIEIWTNLYYDIRWTWGFGPGNATQDNPGPCQTTSQYADEDSEKKRAIFLRQKFIRQGPWVIMEHDMSSQHELPEIRKFKEWLEDKYVGVEVDPQRLHTKLGRAEWTSSLFLQLLSTAMLGGLTRFRIGIVSHAVWLLLWLYGVPTLRWKWLILDKMETRPCLSLTLRLLNVFFTFTVLCVAIGVYGGITVISVELLGAMCSTVFSLSPGVWILIGWAITSAFGFVAILISIMSGTSHSPWSV